MSVSAEVVTSDRDLRDLYQKILVSYFPLRELDPPAELVEGVRRGSRTVLAVRDDDSWLGTAVVDAYSCGTSLLAYLAVAERARGQGVGSSLLHLVQDRLAGGRPWFLAEIERPGSAPDRPEFGDPVRRARFYARAGAKAVPIDHWQPPARAGLPSVRLQLIAVPVGDAVDAIDLADVMCFEEEYHSADDDPTALAMTAASVQQRRTVALVDLAELYR